MELFLKLLERFVVAHEKLASAQAQIALATPSVKAMQAKLDAESGASDEPKATPAAETKAPTAAEKKAAAAKAKAEAEAAKAKAEAETEASAGGGDFEYETLRALIGQTVQTGAKGTEQVKAMLAAYGVKSAKEAPADKWEDMYNDLQERLKGAADEAEFA